MKQEIENNGYFSCYDGAAGAGAMLIAAAEVCVEQGINYPFQVMFTAQEIDSTTALMCYIQLSMLGCAGYVVIGNTLSEPATGHVLFGEDTERCWFTPMFFEETWHRRREIEIARFKFRQLFGAFDKAKPRQVDEEIKEDTLPSEAALELPSEAQAAQEPATPPGAPVLAEESTEPISPAPAICSAPEAPRRHGKHVAGQISLFDL